MAADSATHLTASELLRLDQCVREPIRMPGRIQSHGILFACDKLTTEIDTVSENVTSWLGHPVSDLGIPSLEQCVESGGECDPFRVTIEGRDYDAFAYALDGRVVVELEAEPELQSPSTSLIEAAQRLGNAASSGDARQFAAEELRTVTGFDRVMVYRFFGDGHGEVAGESAVPAMEAYRGLRFPASDIPQQARALYITKLSRVIASTVDPGLALLTTRTDGEPLDLSRAELRTVSPHHLQFMRNMGQGSTVSFSLVHEGRLVGMITCAHRTVRRIAISLRRALEVFATQLAAQIAGLESIEKLRRDLESRERRRVLLASAGAAADPLQSLFSGSQTILDVIPADGAIVQIDGAIRTIGQIPLEDRAALLMAVGEDPLVTDSLRTTHAGIGALLPDVAGLLVTRIGKHGRAAFFRREVTQVIRWLGDQSEDNRESTLSPRRSFSAWSESVSGTSLAWGGVAEDAHQLGRELADVLERREESRLAELAHVDPLTGLHNRRSLLGITAGLLAQGRTGSVMFIDLDRFKAVNDRYGHEAGDIVLRSVAERLVAAVRETDTVARYGGDEFVVLCPDVVGEQQPGVAQRLVDELAMPMEIGSGHSVTVTASCGVVPIDRHQSAADVLAAADAAMYRAKRDGRNQTSS